MGRPQLKNFAVCQVSTSYDAAATSIVLTTGHGAKLPAAGPYWLVWWNWTDYPDPANDPNAEVVDVTARSSDTLTVTRAQDATSATVKNLASKTYKMQLTNNAALFDDLYDRHRFPQCGRFNYSSATACLFVPFNGNKIVINGAIETIPDAGVTLSNASLSAATLYYIYAYLSGSTLTLEASVTTHAAQAGTGIEIKSGDSTRTLVGMIRTNASSQFADSAQQRFVASWFNRVARSLFQSSATTPATGSGTFVEISSSFRLEFVTWAVEHFAINAWATMNNSSAGVLGYLAVALNATTGTTGITSSTVMASSATNYSVATGYAAGLSEGYNWFSFMGATSGGSLSYVSNSYGMAAIVRI